MNELILNMSSRLFDINTLLENKKDYDLFTIDETLLLASFFEDYSNTNRLIEEAEILAKKDITLLFTISSSILEESNKFLSFNISNLYGVNFEKLFEDYIGPFKIRYELKLKEAALQVKDYNEKNNRFDMASIERDGVEGYSRIKSEFELSEIKYKTIQADVKQLYYDLKNEEKKYFCVYTFPPVFFEILMERINHISKSILIDINKIQKEGGII